MTIGSRSLLLTLCVFLAAGSPEAQEPQATSPGVAAAPSGTQTAQPTPFQFSVKVNRVILDVVVTDGRGRPVEGLTADDFKVTEDGVVQPIRNFDVHMAAPETSAQRDIGLRLPANTFSNLALAPSDKPVTVLLYDVLNTPQAALPYAHQALVKFIKDQKNSTKIAIFVLSDRLHMVQGFTDDETRLMEAVDSKAVKSRVSQLRVADSNDATAAVLASDPAAAAQTQQQQPSAGDVSTGADAILAQLNDVEAEEQAYLLRERLEITVNAFANIARFVSVLPGRKNLIWMSGAFPSEIFPDNTVGTGSRGEFNNAILFQEDIRRAQDVLKESRVAIYPVDVRGLQADTQFSASTRYAAGPPKSSTFGLQQAAEHATMDTIADSTGGRAFYNTNGLQEALDAAVRQGSSYYSLTYSPSNTKEDGGERKIKVALKKPGYQLFYRRQYFADDGKTAPAKPLVMDLNMQHGAPNSSELFFEASVVPVGTAMKASPDELANLKTFLEINAKGKRTKLAIGPQTVQHYDVNLAILGRQLQMPPADKGRYATSMRFGLAAYTDNSELLNGVEVSVKNTIPAAQYEKIQAQGYHASMVFAAPQEAVSLRIAVRDEIGNRIGTIEVPLPVHAPKDTAANGTTTK
jgi:VWFA-related protein